MKPTKIQIGKIYKQLVSFEKKDEYIVVVDVVPIKKTNMDNLFDIVILHEGKIRKLARKDEEYFFQWFVGPVDTNGSHE